MKKGSLFTGFAHKLAGNRRLELAVYAVLILSAVLIFTLSGGLFKNRETADEGAKASNLSTSSKTALEARLEAILSSITGVGRARVMLSFKDESEDESSAESKLFSGLGTEKSRESYNEVRGAIIVCEGAGNSAVTERVRNAVMTLLGLNPAQICVFPME